MQFTPVAVAASKSGNVGVSDQVKKDVAEAWEWFEANPGHHLITDEFEDDSAQKAWIRQAQAHAKTLGLTLRVVRDDALKSSIEEAGGKPKIRFHIESEDAKAQRKAEKEAKAAELAARKAAGEVIKPGRKAAK